MENFKNSENQEPDKDAKGSCSEIKPVDEIGTGAQVPEAQSSPSHPEPKKMPPLGTFVLRKFTLNSEVSVATEVLDDDQILDFGEEDPHSKKLSLKLFEAECPNGVVVFRRVSVLLGVKNMMGFAGLHLSDSPFPPRFDLRMLGGEELRLPGIAGYGFKLGIVLQNGISFTSTISPEALHAQVAEEEVKVLVNKFGANLALYQSCFEELGKLARAGTHSLFKKKRKEFTALETILLNLEKEVDSKRAVLVEKKKKCLDLVKGAEEDDTLVCPVCSHMFFYPRVLSCGHNICYACIFRLVSNFNRNSCPVCRGKSFPTAEAKELELRVDQRIGKLGLEEFNERASQQFEHLTWFIEGQGVNQQGNNAAEQ